MRAAAAAFVVVVTVALAWRGYRRGAAAGLRGWLPRLSALAAVYLSAWLTWAITGSLGTTILVAIASAAAAAAAVVLAIRRFSRPADSGDAKEKAAGPSLLNRVAGAGLGIIHAELLCLGLAVLGSTLIFGMSVSQFRADRDATPEPLPEWAVEIGNACRIVADMNEVGLLRRLPLLKEYGREIIPLVAILNAPPEKLAMIAEKRDLMQFADFPAVREALADPEFCGLIEKARRGEVSALRALSDSPITKKLWECPEIREFARTVTPSELLADMDDEPAAE